MQTSISVFGLGYVGCVSAASLASAGFPVMGVDLDAGKVDMINKGISPIVEPGLAELIDREVEGGRLRATQSCEEAVRASDIAFICVGTPGDRNGKLQLDALRRVCQEIGAALKGSKRRFTVVVRSTVLPGTTESVVVPALLKGAGADFKPWLRVAMNPEFIREGSALKDFAHPPYTLVGCDDKETAALLVMVYAAVEAQFIHTSTRTAEAVKYVSNAYHALKVCFANEMGDVCTALGADAQDVMRIFRMDDKLNISPAYLRPGFAFGGSCLPKDVRALLYAAHHEDVALPLLNSILPSNRTQVERGISAILETGKKRIGMFGLAFKAETDDLRESPIVTLVESLIGKGCEVRILDRSVSIAKLRGANRQYIVEEIPHVSSLMCDSAEELMAHADVLVIASEDREAEKLLAMVRPGQLVIDLTRGGLRLKGAARRAA